MPDDVLSGRTLLSGRSKWFDAKLISPEKFAEMLFANDPATARQIGKNEANLARELRRVWIDN